MTVFRLQRGVTLIELMVVLAIIAILLGVGMPSFQSFTLNRQADRLVQQLQLDISYARNHAITHSMPITVTPMNNNWNLGWEVRSNANADGLLRQRGSIDRPLADANTITSTDFTQANPIVFDAQGRSQRIGSVVIDVDGCTGMRERTLRINFIGQIVIEEALCQ